MTGWAVIVPVKPAEVGKSRLVVDGVDRMALARAIALDTIAAAASCEEVDRVVIVTDDEGLVIQASDIPGLRFIAETPPAAEALADALATGTAPVAGLNTAIARGAAAVVGMPRAALLGDLPALRPADLAAALALAARVGRGVVGDAEGTGSTLVTAGADLAWESAFGEGSFEAHRALGCVPLDVETGSTLRRDVDSAEQLAAAAALGLGPRTARLLGA